MLAAMMIFLLLIIIVLYFSIQDFGIRVVMVFNIGRARAYVDRQSKQIIRIIFALAKMLVDFRIVDETDRSISLPGRFVLISNHQSLLDIPVLFSVFPPWGLHFVGKKALFHYILLISVVFRVQRHASINRKGDFANTMRKLARLARLTAREGYSLAVFPEGTRARTGDLGPFQSGAVRAILRNTPLPVVSVAMEGGYRISGLRQLLRNVSHLRYRVKVLSVYPPPKGKSEIDRLVARTRDEISEQLLRWRSPVVADNPR